jgi:aminoglycoside phosphotransferase (APT) family kinase protein
VSSEEEDRLRPQIERLVGGTVTALARQPRWRKAWYATVQRGAETIQIYVRGDKQIDAEVFPGLAREATILQLFAQGGLPVPHVYGMTEDPVGIVMDRVPGRREVIHAASDAERRHIARRYIDVLARMHSLDQAPFIAAGIDEPEGAEAIALAYLRPNVTLYRRTKRGAQPLVEFALLWMQRNVPRHRQVSAMIHADPGQFLFEHGKLTCIYDFEASHIGDPLADLAALRTRHGTEPLGAEPSELIAYYQALTGTKVDLPALSYHTACFMLTAVMALAGPMTEPGPADMQLEYMTWDLMTRRAMLWAMAECMGISITPSAKVSPPEGRTGLVATVTHATIGRIDPACEIGTVDREAAQVLAAWSRGQAASGAAHEMADLRRAAALLGYQPADWQAADAALEQFVLQAGPEHDLALLNYFAAQTEDRVAEAIPIQTRLDHYGLSPVVLGAG